MKINTKLLMCLSCTLMTGNLMAQSSCFTEEEENVINSMNKTVKEPAAFLRDDALAYIVKHYCYNNGQFPILKKYCHNRELKKYVHNFIESNPLDRLIVKERIDSIYSDSINTILIPYNPSLSGKAISLALRMSDVMNVSDKKQSKLMDKALDFARRLRKNPFTNFAREEMDCLQKNLNKNQLNLVLNEKNNPNAMFQAEKTWGILEKNNLTNQLDSAQQMSLAYNYYLTELRYKDLYVEQYKTMNRNLQEIYKRKPKIIKMYEAIEEKQRMAELHKEFEEQQKEKKVGGEFSW